MVYGCDVIEEIDVGCVCDWDSNLWYVKFVYVDVIVCYFVFEW